MDEYYGNTSLNSIEGIFIDNIGVFVNPKIQTELRTPDNDYLQNTIGDIVSGLISNLLIFGYWIKYGKLPYLYFSIVVLYLLYKKSYMLYDTNKDK